MTTFEMNNAIENSLHPPLDKYAIYLRKSQADIEADKHNDEETLARHKRILTELAARKGLYVERIYHEVVSGDTIKDRPEFQKLITDCYAGMYRGIIVVEVTRLSRGSQGDAQVIMDCLRFSNQNKGLLVITPTKTYDVAHNSDDEEYMEFELFMSRREYKMIKKRMERGRKQAVVEGFYMGSYRPYGYDIEETKAGRTLKPNPVEAPIVQLMFEWAAKDQLTPGQTARRLTAMGAPTYSGKAEWGRETVVDILQNPIHKGKVRWNDRMTVKTLVDGELKTSRPRSNHTEHYMEYDGQHPAIVDAETWAAANSRFYSDRTKSGLKLQNPFAGLIVCKNCGKAMWYRKGKTKDNTDARLMHKTSVLCHVKSAMFDDVQNAIIHALKLYIEDFELKVDNLPTVDENSLLTQITALEKEKIKINKKLDKLFDAWENDDITDNEFVKRKAVNNDRLKNIDIQINELKDSIPEKEEYQEKIMLLSDALNAVLDKDIDAEAKNQFLKAIIKRIEFSRENSEEFVLDIFLR